MPIENNVRNGILLAYGILLDVGLLSSENYNGYLDAMFTETPDDDLLLELEWCSSHTQKTIRMIYSFCRETSIEHSVLGKTLTSTAKKIYLKNEMSINAFGSLMYKAWQLLPREIQYDDPFHILSYADDPLSWGDVEQTRELYETFFNYYSNTDD